MINLTEREIKLWVLIMCKLNKEYRGISLTELLQKRPKEIENYGAIFNLPHQMKNDGLVSEDIIKESKNLLPPLYNITEKGQKILNEASRKEMIKVFNLTPPEYSLTARITRIENAFYYGILTITFTLATWFLKTNITAYSIFGLISYIQLLNFLLAFMGVIEVPVLNIINKWSGKTYSLLDRRIKGISIFLFVFIMGSLLLTWYLTYEQNFMDNLWPIGIGLLLGGAYIIDNPVRRLIERGLEKLKNKLKP